MADPRLVSLLNKLLAGAALAAMAYFGERGDDGGFIKDVWAAAKTASPFAAMFAIMAWLDERRERREAQRQCNERTVDFIQSTNSQFNSLGSIHEAIKQLAANFLATIGVEKRGKVRRGGKQ